MPPGMGLPPCCCCCCRPGAESDMVKFSIYIIERVADVDVVVFVGESSVCTKRPTEPR